MAPDANAGVLSSFLDYLRIEKGLAPLSISAYSTDICQFCEFLEKHKRQLMKARRSDVRDFLQQLFSHQVDGRSVGGKLSWFPNFTAIYCWIRKSNTTRRSTSSRQDNGR